MRSIGTLVGVAIAGFIAQLIDGSLGMAYGVTTASILLAIGVAPAASSAAVHMAELGTTLVSGISHHKLGNIDWRTVAIMAIPGGLAAFVGATFLANIDGDLITPFIAVILLSLGVYIIVKTLILRPRTANRTHQKPLSAFFLTPIALVGGLLDAIGGGGWGPVGTTTLLSSGRLEPRKVIGSIDTSEFIVALGGSLGFIFALGISGISWDLVLALLIGGVIAAPIAAVLVKIFPPVVLATAAGGLIIVTNLRTLLRTFEVPGLTLSIVLGIAVLIWFALIAVAIQRYRAQRNDLAAAAQSAIKDQESAGV